MAVIKNSNTFVDNPLLGLYCQVSSSLGDLFTPLINVL